MLKQLKHSITYIKTLDCLSFSYQTMQHMPLTGREKSHSVHLEDLNPEISKKLQKFNTSSDGQLSLEEAVQGLITLQKQSNNYKRTLWLMAPVMILLILATFGTSIASIKLTQQMQVSGSRLTDMNGSPIKVSIDSVRAPLVQTMLSEDVFDMTYVRFPNSKFKVNYVFVERDSSFGITESWLGCEGAVFHVSSASNSTLDVHYTADASLPTRLVQENQVRLTHPSKLVCTNQACLDWEAGKDKKKKSGPKKAFEMSEDMDWDGDE